MNTAVIARFGNPARRLATTPSVASYRTALVAGSAAAAALAWLVASGAAQPAVEPDLVVLLRGMAVIKSLLAAGAAALVWWRLSLPLAKRGRGLCRLHLGPLRGQRLVARPAFLVEAALLYHAAGLFVLVLALREGHAPRAVSPGNI